MLAVDPEPQGLLNGGKASSPSGLHLWQKKPEGIFIRHVPALPSIIFFLLAKYPLKIIQEFSSFFVQCSEVLQCSDGLSYKVSNIIRRHIDNMKLLLICILLLSHSFLFFRFYFY